VCGSVGSLPIVRGLSADWIPNVSKTFAISRVKAVSGRWRSVLTEPFAIQNLIIGTSSRP